MGILHALLTVAVLVYLLYALIRPEKAAARALTATDRTHVRIAGDRGLVAVGPDEQAAELVRAGKRMADALDAEWMVVYVETRRRRWPPR